MVINQFELFKFLLMSQFVFNFVTQLVTRVLIIHVDIHTNLILNLFKFTFIHCSFFNYSLLYYMRLLILQPNLIQSTCLPN